MLAGTTEHRRECGLRPGGIAPKQIAHAGLKAGRNAPGAGRWNPVQPWQGQIALAAGEVGITQSERRRVPLRLQAGGVAEIAQPGIVIGIGDAPDVRLKGGGRRRRQLRRKGRDGGIVRSAAGRPRPRGAPARNAAGRPDARECSSNRTPGRTG